MKRHFYTAGMTMVELLTVMAIVAILIGIATPSYRYITTVNRISSEVNGLLGDMQLARIEAIKQGSPVTVCASSDGATCLGGTSTTWTRGWIVFSDLNGNGLVDVSVPPETVLRIQRAFAGTDTAVADVAAPAVVFNRDGFARLGAVTTIKVHDVTNTSVYARCLEITPVGSMTTLRAGVRNCS